MSLIRQPAIQPAADRSQFSPLSLSSFSLSPNQFTHQNCGDKDVGFWSPSSPHRTHLLSSLLWILLRTKWCVWALGWISQFSVTNHFYDHQRFWVKKKVKNDPGRKKTQTMTIFLWLTLQDFHESGSWFLSAKINYPRKWPGSGVFLRAVFFLLLKRKNKMDGEINVSQELEFYSLFIAQPEPSLMILFSQTQGRQNFTFGSVYIPTISSVSSCSAFLLSWKNKYWAYVRYDDFRGLAIPSWLIDVRIHHLFWAKRISSRDNDLKIQISSCRLNIAVLEAWSCCHFCSVTTRRKLSQFSNRQTTFLIYIKPTHLLILRL